MGLVHAAKLPVSSEHSKPTTAPLSVPEKRNDAGIPRPEQLDAVDRSVLRI
jgi:hypothetical protein